MALDDSDESLINIKYLEYVLHASDFATVITGVAQPQITRTSLKRLNTPIPPLDEQRRFARMVETVERQKARFRTHLAELDALFASLQHRAFRGEL